MNLSHWIERNALKRPDAAAVGAGTRVVLTHGELRDRVESLAGGLKQLGLRRGDRVALAMKNVPEYFEVLFAIWQAGAIDAARSRCRRKGWSIRPPWRRAIPAILCWSP